MDENFIEKQDLYLANCVKISVERGWGYSAFKDFIRQFLLTDNDEDQWQLDFESYVLTIDALITGHKYEHPGEWGEEYFNVRWNTKKWLKFKKRNIMSKRKGKLKDRRELLSPPGDTILENMRHLKINQSEFIEKMGITFYEAECLISGKELLTRTLAVKLEEIFGIDKQFWINREASYREELGELEELERAEAAERED